MFRRFQKSRALVILRSLITSPIAITITIVLCFTLAVSTLLTIVYYMFQLNVYLLNKGILFTIPNRNGDVIIDANASLWMLIEILIILVLIGFCLLIRKTIQKVNKDIENYELEAVEWQK